MIPRLGPLLRRLQHVPPEEIDPVPDHRPFVVIDPGHGGQDPGAVGANGTRESNLALALGKELAAEMASRGIKVAMTRVEDVRVGLHERADKANEQRADLFVSLHFNASAKPTAKGIWILHAKGSATGEKVARAIYSELVPDQPERVYADGTGWTGHRSLTVLQKTDMPAVLIEGGFVTCPEELAEILKPGWNERAAERITSGVLAWVESFR